MTCPNHIFVTGPFYLHLAVTSEEPDYYPPQGMIPVEHCPACGAIRIPEAYREHIGRNLASSGRMMETRSGLNQGG